MQIAQQVKSISYLRTHAAHIATELEDNGSPFIITQNGEAAMVVQGVKQYQDTENLLALLKLLALGEGDRLAGQGLSAQASRAALAQARQERAGA